MSNTSPSLEGFVFLNFEFMSYREKLLSYFLRRDRGWILSLFAAVCLVYLPFLGSPFVFDDLSFFLGNPEKQYTHSLFQFELRWLPYASLGWTSVIFSDAVPHFFHLGNLLLHAANVTLLFILLRRVVGAVIADNKNSSAVTWGAWFGALIFACHPVAVYAVGYVIERSILMATLFSLVAQLAYLRGLLTGQKRWLALAVGAYFLACFSKEHSVMLPALLAAQTILLRTKISAGKGALWSTGIAFLAIALWVISLAKGVSGVPYEPMAASSLEQNGIVESTSMLHGLSALTQAGLFFKYLWLWMLPNPAWMSMDMREYFVSSWLAWQGWLGTISFVAYGALGGWLLLRPRWMGIVGLALLYPWLQFMVEFTAIRVQEPFVLYRSYLWMPGMMLFFPLLLAKLPGIRACGLSKLHGNDVTNSPPQSVLNGEREEKPSSDKTTSHSTRLPKDGSLVAGYLQENGWEGDKRNINRTLLGMGLIVLLLVPLAWNRLWVFADNYRLWNDAAQLLHSKQEPGAYRIFYSRGQAEASMHKWDDAILDFQRAVALSPQLASLRYQLGIAYVSSGHYQEALAQFDAESALKPDDARAYYGKGLSLMGMHEREQALQQMKKGCELGLGVKLACMMAGWEQNKK